MKKWLMSALLPLLLLAQQGAGAVMLKLTSSVSGDNGYTTLIDIQDKKADITITFNKGLDLGAAEALEQNGASSVAIGNITPNTVMRFIITDIDGNPSLKIINLAYNPSINNQQNVVLDTIGPFSSGPTFDPNPIVAGKSTKMTATYTQTSDLSSGDFKYTCLILNSDLQVPNAPVRDDGCSTQDNNTPPNFIYLANLNPVSSIPLPNSFMLLGIGLMALGIPRRQGRLF